jgi:hypothetical protein
MQASASVEAAQVNMVAPQPENKVKMVKIKTKTAILVGEMIVPQDTVVDVSEDLAIEYCDRKIKQHFNFSGELSEKSATRYETVRAVRI